MKPSHPDGIPDDRVAVERARWLACAYDADEDVMLTLAYSELGFTSSGIASRVGVTEATVRQRLDDLAREYGLVAVSSRRPEELAQFPTFPLPGTEGGTDGE